MFKQNVVLLSVLLFFSSIAFPTYYNASIVLDSGSPQNVSYYSPANAFVDGVTGTPQVKLRVYSDTPGTLAGKYATFLYRAGNSYKTISVTPTSNFAVLGTENPVGSNVYAESPLNLDFNSILAAYPGKVFAVISSDANVDVASDSFVYIPAENGWLKGSFTTNNVQNSYNPSTQKVTVRVTGVTGTTATGTATITTDTNALAIGVCSDAYGSSCVDSALTGTTAVSLNTGVSPSTAQATPQTLYYVVNGIGTSFCIGSDLTGTVSLNTSSPSDGDPLGITVVITNSGNVEMASNFHVSVYYDSVTPSKLISRTSVTGPIAVGGSKQISSSWDTTLQTGAHTIIAVIDADSVIPECSDANNQATASVTVQTSYYLTLYIDGFPMRTFPQPGRPYNVTLHVNNSLGQNTDNAVVQIIEKNSLLTNAPTQIWTENGVKRGVVTYATVEVTTNDSGRVSFTYIPTGNKLYDTNPTLYQYIGAHTFNAKVFVGGTLKRSVPLTLPLNTPPTPNQRIYSQRQENVRASFELINNLFTTQKRWYGNSST